MSCEKCEEVQETSYNQCYVRVGNANVLIVGCDKHLKELIRLLRVAREMETEKGARVTENE